MTQKQDENKIKPEAVELEDAQFEQAQGGILDGSSNTRAPRASGIRDGSSHILDGTSNILDGTSNILDGTNNIRP